MVLNIVLCDVICLLACVFLLLLNFIFIQIFLLEYFSIFRSQSSHASTIDEESRSANITDEETDDDDEFKNNSNDEDNSSNPPGPSLSIMNLS